MMWGHMMECLTNDKLTILLLGRNHWITVSNMGWDSSGQVKVYDSIYSKFPASWRKKVVEPIAWMLFTDQCTSTPFAVAGCAASAW